MRATIKDIARRLNVSVSTVSYALNGGPRKVQPEVRDRVLAVARELDYRPNSLARSMATGRTDTLAIVPPRGSHPMLLSPYIQAVINSAVEAAESLGQDILLQTAADGKDSYTIANSLLGGRSDGVLVVAPPIDSELDRHVAERDFPCVVMAADGPPGTVTVTIDNRHATWQALEHLIGLGHRKIGHIAGRHEQRDGIERRDAYLAFMREHDLPVRDGWLEFGEFAYILAREAAHEMLACPHRPTAILAANDESGLAATDVAMEMGLRVPEDLSVVSFDDLPEYSLRRGDLTSVRQPIRQMTARAMELLVEWVREGERPHPERYVFPTELVVRNSTAPPCVP